MVTAESFTFIAAPRDQGLDILAVLRDWSALGFVSEFIWADTESLSNRSGPIEGLVVSAGEARFVDVQRELAVRGGTARMRICLVDPLTGNDPLRVVERARLELGAASPDTPQTLVHCIVTALGAKSREDLRVRQGWHGIVIAPEDSQTPTASRRQVRADEDRVDLSMHFASGIASVLGMWSGIEGCALDNLRSDAPDQARLARGFFQELDAAEVGSGIRNSLTSVYPALPRPTSDGRPLPRVEDEEGAARQAAEGLLAQHPWLLESQRESVPQPTQEGIGLIRSIKMFFGFLLAALKRAPKEWWNRLVARGATNIAGMTQRVVFGSDSEYAVVVRGRLPDGRLASLAEMLESSDRLLASLPPELRHEETKHDLSQFWRDFHAVGLDLADGAERVPGAMPPRVGSRPAVVTSASSIAAPPEESFTEIPGSIAASIGVERISPADFARTREVMERLTELGQAHGASPEVGVVRSELAAWSDQVQRHCYTGRVGARLAKTTIGLREELDRIRRSLLDLNEARSPDAAFGERQRRLAQRTRWMFWLGFAVVVGLLFAGNRGWLPWPDAIKWVALAVVLEAIIQLYIYLQGQQALFQFLHRQEEMEREALILLRNFSAALTDLRRVSAAYRQFVPMAEVLGSFISQPLGPGISVQDRTRLPDGPLPVSMKLGRINFDEAALRPMLGELRASLFVVGWMTEAYERFLGHVGDVLGPGSEEFVHDPKLIFADSANGLNSPLRRWAQALIRQGTTMDLGDEIWSRAVSMLNDRDFSAGKTALAEQATWAEELQPVGGFCGGLTRSAAVESQFDTEILQSLIVAGPGKEPDPEVILETRRTDGLGGSCVLAVFGKPFEVRYLNVETEPPGFIPVVPEPLPKGPF